MLTEEEKLQYQKLDQEYEAKKAERLADAQQEVFSKEDEEWMANDARLEEKYGELILSDKTKVRAGDPKGALFQGKTIFKEDTEFSPKNIKPEEKQKADAKPKPNTMPVVKNINEP